MATIKFQETTEREIEIEFPYFTKTSCFVYALLNDAMAIEIQFNPVRHIEVMNHIPQHSLDVKHAKQCEASDFYEQYYIAKEETINAMKMLDSMMGAPFTTMYEPEQSE